MQLRLSIRIAGQPVPARSAQMLGVRKSISPTAKPQLARKQPVAYHPEVHCEGKRMSEGSGLARVALRVLMGSVLLLANFGASGEVLLRLQRLSDTQVILVGSGFLGAVVPAENQHALSLIDPFSVRPAPLVNHRILEDSDLYAGSFVFNFANDAGSGIGDSFTNTIYIGRDVGTLPFPQIPSAELFSGTMFLDLGSDATFAPIGSAGDVFWGTTTGNIRGVLSGRWEMVAAIPVPEASSYALMLGGLLLLAMHAARSNRPRSSHPAISHADA
jgi:hypothetical protein